MARQTNRWLAAMIAVMSLETVSPSWAIPITNPGFEADPVGDITVSPQRYNDTSGGAQFFDPVATGWTLLVPTITDPTFTDNRLAGIQDLNNSPYLNHNPDGSVSTTADDNNMMFLGRSNQVSQAVAAVFGPTVDYTLTVRATRLNNQSKFAGGRLILGYGTASSFTTLAVVTNVDNSAGLDTLPDAAPGEWTTITLNYTTGVSGPELGQNIVIAFAPTDTYAGVSSYIDNFTLIPEPSTVTVTCCGLILLWLRRSR
jgi:hypothetical protein